MNLQLLFLIAAVLAAFGCLSQLLGIRPGVFLVNLAVLAALFGLLQLARKLAQQLNSLSVVAEETTTGKPAVRRMK